MDLLIIQSSLFTFFIFLVVQIIVFRNLGSTKILKGMYYSFFIVSMLHFIFFFKSFGLIYFLVSYLILIFLNLIYIWSIVGVATTSLRMQLLMEIAKAGPKGILYSELLRKYNRSVIVKNRIQRLSDSGEIAKLGKFYVYKGKISYFSIHLFLIGLLNKLYAKRRYSF